MRSAIDSYTRSAGTTSRSSRLSKRLRSLADRLRDSDKRSELLQDSLEFVLPIAGLASGVTLASLFMFKPDAVLALTAWLKKDDWYLDAFGAFGTMSGFALAALSLIASLTGHPRASEALDDNSGRWMVRMLVRSMWAWLLPALAALAVIFSGADLARASFVLFACLAAGQGCLALAALTRFFRRYSDKKSH